MIYKNDELQLEKNRVTDAIGTIRLEDIPEGTPGCSLKLKPDASPMMHRLWQRALADVMKNRVERNGVSYLEPVPYGYVTDT